jgi:quercetin dioxygenase-like cupin family protein
MRGEDMKGRIILVLVAPVVLAAAFATSSFGLSSSLLVRGDATEFDLRDRSERLRLRAKEPIHIDIRLVTLLASEPIDWHGHAGPSLLIVKSGSLTVTEPRGKTCSETTHEAGAAFVHSEDVHRFRAGAAGAEFYIVYLLPDGASPAPIAMPAPSGCS